MFNKNSKNEKSPSLFNRIEQNISDILTLYSGRPLPGISKTSLLVDWLLFGITDYKKNKTDDILKLLKRKIHYRSSHDLNYLITEIFFYKIYYFHSTKPNPRILDCGANIGLATLFFKILYPNSIIEAFEPDPELFSILKRNVTENQLSNVHVYNYALGEKNGIGEFYPNINPTIGQLGKFAPGSLPPIQVTIR
ncbi:hypothetical protein A7Q09_01560 [Methylacidiphilum sp. Yel]|uniref:FkbM family methyltransferase n=1 Tax=Methylacidiphilum sp. Yel TaxID=1847730 RepID=UPI00106A9B6A|nr:FkbM family methyltransferase [Methylacidiphilum sp. Yel]TFE67171.1 hypothetical protein A7Q09_01560 [Methylacidiphilum sp. Yel]